MESSRFPDGFFRQEVARPARSWLPSVPVRSPRIGWLVLVLAACCLAGLGALLILGSYTQYKTGEGAIVAASAGKRVKAGIAGVVRRVPVKPGQHVERGSLLAIVEAEVFGPPGQSPLALSGTELSASIAVEEQQMQDIREHARVRGSLLHAQLRDAQRKAEAVQLELDAQAERAENARKIFEATAAAEAAKLVSKVQMLMQKDSMLAARTQAIAQRRALLDANEHTRSLRVQLDSLHEESAREIGAQKVRISELKIRRAQASASRTRRVASPVSGVVSDLLVEPGTPVGPDQVLMVVGARGGQLMIEAFVSPELVRNLHVGDPLEFRLRGAHSTDYRPARVASLSPPLYDEQGGLVTNRAGAQKARVTLSVHGADLGGSSTSRLGLVADISFPVGSRRLYELAFD